MTHPIYFNRKIVFLLIAIYLGNAILHAQTENLDQLLERGKKSYPLLKAKEYEVYSSEEKVDAAQTDYLPNLIVGHQYTFGTSNNVEGAFLSNEGSALSPSGGIHPANVYTGTFGSLTSALFDWKIVNFGKVKANVTAVMAENEKSRADYENELFQYQVNVADTYLLLLASQRLTMVQQKNLERAEILVNVIRSKVLAGLRPGVDSSLANAEYVKAKIMLLESQKNERVYEYKLLELLADTNGFSGIDTMHFFSTLPHEITVQSSSLNASPRLKFYQSGIDLSQARSTAIRRSLLPSLSLTGAVWARGSGISNIDQVYHTDFASGTQYQVYNYLLGATLRWNFTNYLRVSNDYKSEQFQLERYRYLYNYQYNLQTRELAESELQLNVSLQQAELAPVQLTAAQQAYEQAKARYESGLIDLPTYHQSLVTLNRAEADRYMAFANAWRSLLMKAAAAGDLSIFLNQAH